MESSGRKVRGITASQSHGVCFGSWQHQQKRLVSLKSFALAIHLDCDFTGKWAGSSQWRPLAWIFHRCNGCSPDRHLVRTQWLPWWCIQVSNFPADAVHLLPVPGQSRPNLRRSFFAVDLLRPEQHPPRFGNKWRRATDFLFLEILPSWFLQKKNKFHFKKKSI